MKIVRSKEFRADRPWGAPDIATMNGITTRLHWTDQPHRWHVNDGEEVFAVLDGKVEMRHRQDGQEHCTQLHAGDVLFAGAACEPRCEVLARLPEAGHGAMLSPLPPLESGSVAERLLGDPPRFDRTAAARRRRSSTCGSPHAALARVPPVTAARR